MTQDIVVKGSKGGGRRKPDLNRQRLSIYCCAWFTELQDMHQAAQSDAKESREELDSLSNLIGRLDFNDYFKPKPDYRAMLANGTI